MIQDEGTMLDGDAMNMEKRPRRCSIDVVHPDADAAGDATPTIHNSKRFRFRPSFPPPLTALKRDDEEYPLCQECPNTGVVAGAGTPLAWRDVEGRRVPARGEEEAPPPPAAASREERAPFLPTADDYANLMFSDAFEEAGEESARTGRLLLAAAELSPDPDDDDDAAPRRAERGEGRPHKRKQRRVSADAATSRTTTTTSAQKRRRVSFESISKVHLLADTPPCRDMSPEEKSILWFDRSDLEAMKSSAQRSVQEMRDRVKTSRKGGAAFKERSEFRALVVAMEDETGSSVRGLEHKVFNRKQPRRELIRDVLKCQFHVRGLANYGHAMHEKERARLLVRVSQERSLKARRVAYADARDDHREIYSDNVPAGGDGIRIPERTLERRKKRSAVISL